MELRKNNLAHLTLNSNNIILQPENKIKVINFGQAQEFPVNQQVITLTEPFNSTLTCYLAPEILENKAHINSDIYSFGMLISKLFEVEFENLRNKKARNNDTE